MYSFMRYLVNNNHITYLILKILYVYYKLDTIKIIAYLLYSQNFPGTVSNAYIVTDFFFRWGVSQ